MKTLKPWMLNVVTLVVVGLFLVAQGVGAKPDSELTAPPAVPSAAAQTVISYQGMLTDQNGNPLDETVTMEFALYDAATDGNRLWGPETQSVVVDNGLFHVLLGSVEAMDPDTLTGDLYLGITVNGEELLPRELLTSVTYAVEATTLPNGATTRGDLQVDGRLRIATTGESLLIKPQAMGAGDVSKIVFDDPDGGTAAMSIEYQDDGNASLTIKGGGIEVSNGTTGLQIRPGYRDNTPDNDWTTLEMPGLKHLRVWDYLSVANDLTVDGLNIYLGGSSPGRVALRQDGSRTLHLLPWGGAGYDYDNICIGCGANADLIVRGNVTCGGLTEANLQTPEELAAERIERFEEGDLLCWAGDRLEKCDTLGDPLVQAVADAEGRPIVIGAEVVKVIGPVHYGDLLVASDVPGYAMVDNDPRPGAVIAQALEDFEGEKGIIKAMIRKF